MAQKGNLSTSSAMTFNSRRHDVTSIEQYSTNPDVCLFATSLDYVSHMGKCLYWLMKTVARKEFIEGKTLASVNI